MAEPHNQIADEELHLLAKSYGVATEFVDYQGQPRAVSSQTLHAVLAALGAELTSTAQVAELAQQRADQQARETIAATVVHTRYSGATIDVTSATGDSPTVVIITEDGGRVPVTTIQHQENFDIAGDNRTRYCYEFPDQVPDGYHTISVATADGTSNAHLIAAPGRVPQHPGLDDKRHGTAVQLYSVLSANSWGIGDFADLADLSVWAANHTGADFVQINPVHAVAPATPMERSPYLPSSRRFYNPMYIRIEDIREWAYLDPATTTPMRWTREDLNHAVGATGSINHNAVWEVKRQALWQVFEAGRSYARQAEFDGFCDQAGSGLTDFATWCAIHEHTAGRDEPWPNGFDQPHSEQVRTWRKTHEKHVDFHRWLQWVCNEQLATAQHAAKQAGMTYGIIHDLAVGVHPAGADSWTLSHALTKDVTVGAPPDGFNQQGQDWSQPPWHPEGLARVGYQPFREVVQAALRHAGGLRLDHVMGLFRLWWIPAGQPASAGTYVYYNDEAMLGVVSLEAWRAGAVVIGEDLGTVEPVVREKLANRGFLGTNVLWFEQNDDGVIPPHRWRPECLATVTTHDLPPTASYLSAEHVAVRHQVGVLGRSAEDELSAAKREVETVIDGVRERGLIDDRSTDAQISVALHNYLQLTPAQLMAWTLTDAVGEHRMQNIPGTNTEYPNWTIPLADADGRVVRITDLAAHPHVAAFVQGIKDGAVAASMDHTPVP